MAHFQVVQIQGCIHICRIVVAFRWKIIFRSVRSDLLHLSLQCRHNERDASQIPGVSIAYSTVCSQSLMTPNFYVLFDLRLNKRLRKQSRCRWFKTPSRSLWRPCNAYIPRYLLQVAIRSYCINIFTSQLWLQAVSYDTSSNKIFLVLPICCWAYYFLSVMWPKMIETVISNFIYLYIWYISTLKPETTMSLFSKNNFIS